MIQIENLRFSYGTKPVLQGVEFALSSCGLTALLGCNGAGKTTLMRCILGLEKKYEGHIILKGKELSSYAPRELASLIAYIPQIHYPSFSYSVLDMVLMGSTHELNPFNSPGEKQKKQAWEALEKMGIAHLGERSFTHLSGGEKQLVLIARALTQNAHLLLMDEPCSALDFGNQGLVMETVRSLAKENYSVLMSTHNPQHALSYCDRVIALSEGKVLCDGSPLQVMDERLMKTLYSIPVVFADTAYGRVVVPLHGKEKPHPVEDC